MPDFSIDAAGKGQRRFAILYSDLRMQNLIFFLQNFIDDRSLGGISYQIAALTELEVLVLKGSRIVLYDDFGDIFPSLAKLDELF